MSAGYSRSTYYVLAFIVLAVVFWLWPDPTGKFIKLDPFFPGQEPSLRGALSQPVTLRYAFAAKKPPQRNLEIHLVAYQGQTHDSKRPADEKKPLALHRIILDFVYEPVSCDAQAVCDLRLIVKRIRASGQRGKNYDSANKSTSTQLVPRIYDALVKTPVPLRVHTSGKVESVNIKPVSDALGKMATPPAIMHLNTLVQSLSNDLFVVFPEKPVGINETFANPELSIHFADLTTLKISKKFTLKGVSADGSQALLQTEMTTRMVGSEGALKTPPGYTITLEGAKAKGWVLYDTKAQDVLRSASDIEFSFSVTNNKEQFKQMSHFKALYRSNP